VVFAPDSDDPSFTPDPESIPVQRAAEFVTEQGNPDNAKKVLRIDLGAPIPQLQSGLVLVDTPGLGSLNPAHTAATRAFLRQADAVLFVASAVEPLGDPELAILRLALRSAPVVITVLTKIDNVTSSAPVVAEARRRIAAVAGVDPADLVIVPVSSFRKREALEDDDATLLAESGFPQLEASYGAGSPSPVEQPR
jgi:signal recognition particle receptor subunit beta